MRAAVLALLAIGCVPPVPLDDTPCPCGVGAICCASTGTCLPTIAACPTAPPASSAAACERDQDCANPLERCASWRLTGSALSGPRTCRRSCDGNVCASGESCRFSPHDASSLADLSLALLCLEAPPAGCEGWICQNCGDLRPGETVCRNEERLGCVVAVDDRCGAACQRVVLGGCQNIVPLCQNFPCTCTPGAPPMCVDHQLSACFTATAPSDETCEAICTERSVGGC